MAESMLVDQIANLRQRRTAPLILELDLSEGLAEERPADPVSAILARRRQVLADILDGLRRARSDQRVKVLVARVGGRSMGLAMVQELRQAIEDFRDAGKATIAWSESFGEFTAGNVPYYLATAFDTICMQPSGDLGLTGMAIERRFYRGALDRIGVQTQVAARHEYKGAADTLTETGFTGPAREAAQRMAESVTGQLASSIAERRRLPLDRVRELIDQGPFLASEALEHKLVDVLAYRDEVYTRARKEAGEHPVILPLARYQRAKVVSERAKKLPSQLPAPRERAVALVYATGPIRLGRSGRGPLSGGAMGSDTIAGAIRAATADEQVRAIVLRVNSPGGSYVASDTIWREVVRARAAGKPVVASMGDVAASGGYFISMAADAIVAQPGTITGSIGVLTGKAVISDLLGRIGVTTDSVNVGAHSAMSSNNRPFTEEEWAMVNRWLDHIYDDFTQKVADGRRLSRERVHELARGRVWTGADAREHGLVDEIGGLDRAAAIARIRAGLPASAPLRSYPRSSPLSRLRPPGASENPAAAVFAEGWGPAWQLAAQAGLSPHGPLMLPGTWIIT
jgi:protease-4